MHGKHGACYIEDPTSAAAHLMQPQRFTDPTYCWQSPPDPPRSLWAAELSKTPTQYKWGFPIAGGGLVSYRFVLAEFVALEHAGLYVYFCIQGRSSLRHCGFNGVFLCRRRIQCWRLARSRRITLARDSRKSRGPALGFCRATTGKERRRSRSCTTARSPGMLPAPGTTPASSRRCAHVPACAHITRELSTLGCLRTANGCPCFISQPCLLCPSARAWPASETFLLMM